MMEKVEKVLNERYEEIGWLGIVIMGLSVTTIPHNIDSLAILGVTFAIGLILWIPSLVLWDKE